MDGGEFLSSVCTAILFSLFLSAPPGPARVRAHMVHTYVLQTLLPTVRVLYEAPPTGRPEIYLFHAAVFLCPVRNK
eukprot:scaffold4171_cov185-Skeletonema_menzelii.AAC.3